MDAIEINRVISACAKARVKSIRWEGVEIVFDKFDEPTQERQVLSVAQDTSSSVALKESMDAFAKQQEQIEIEMQVLTDPLAWEEGATSGNE
jgi:ABC-type molybdate transport system substrate-binding protein